MTGPTGTEGRHSGGTVPPPVPGTVPGGTAAGAVPGTGTGAGVVPPRRLPLAPPPALPSDVVPVTVPERMISAARHSAGAALSGVREVEQSVTRFAYSFTHPQPETMKRHRAYVKSRSWVPDGMPEGPRKAFVGATVFHHVVIGRPLKAVAKSVRFAAMKADEAGDRPLFFYGWVAFFGLLVLILFLAHLL